MSSDTNPEYLKLTSYFGERLSTGDRFVADALLDLCGRSELAISVMLRGIASFGPSHQLRSDRLLSMSEDPPVVVAAIDTADKIAALANRAVSMTTSGVVTLERARLVGRSAAPPANDEHAKLTIYVGRRHRMAGRPAYVAVCEALYRRGFAGATVFLGVDGTVDGQRRRARFFSGNGDVPLMIIAVGTRDQVEEAIPELETSLPRPMFTVERIQVCKRGGQSLTRPATLPAVDDDGRPLQQKLMIYTSEDNLHDGDPIHRSIVRRLLETNSAKGATVLRGVWGFHGEDKPHGDKLFQLGRRVPLSTIVIDTPERIAASFDIVDELTATHGVVTSELVPAAVTIANGEQRGDIRLAHFSY